MKIPLIKKAQTKYQPVKPFADPFTQFNNLLTRLQLFNKSRQTNFEPSENGKINILVFPVFKLRASMVEHCLQ